MYHILLIIHTMIAVALIAIILFQRSSQDGLGLSGGGNNVLSGRGQANLVTRTTAILATLIILTSLALGVVIKQDRDASFTDAAVKAGTAPAAKLPAAAADSKQPAADGKAAPATKTDAKPAAPVVPTGE